MRDLNRFGARIAFTLQPTAIGPDPLVLENLKAENNVQTNAELLFRIFNDTELRIEFQNGQTVSSTIGPDEWQANGNDTIVPKPSTLQTFARELGAPSASNVLFIPKASGVFSTRVPESKSIESLSAKGMLNIDRIALVKGGKTTDIGMFQFSPFTDCIRDSNNNNMSQISVRNVQFVAGIYPTTSFLIENNYKIVNGDDSNDVDDSPNDSLKHTQVPP